MLDSPIHLTPDVVPRVWGGQRLASEFGRELGQEPVGESWEIHGDLKVRDSDITLDQLVARHGRALVGTGVDPKDGFPLLTKWLDCRAWLSVQIHPDDALAREFSGRPGARGKTEAWYVHRATSEAELIHGLAEGVSSEDLEQVEGDEIVGKLNRVRPREGQLLFTPAGAVHALGPGSLIYEVQQSCDLTYRFYDWGRPRELHLEKAVACLKRTEPEPATLMKNRLTCRYFDFELLTEAAAWEVTEASFQILASTQSGLTLTWPGGSCTLRAGQSVLLPAGLGSVRVEGEFKDPLIRVSVPESVE